MSHLRFLSLSAIVSSALPVLFSGLALFVAGCTTSSIQPKRVDTTYSTHKQNRIEHGKNVVKNTDVSAATANSGAGNESYTNDSTILRNFWKPDGVVNSVHASAFNAWLKNNEGGVDIATFLYSSQYAGERSKAVADLISGQTKAKPPGAGAPIPVKSHNQAESPPLPESDSDALRNYWKPNGVVNAERAAALRAWLNSYEKGIDIATFIDSPEYATERPKAVATLIKSR